MSNIALDHGGTIDKFVGDAMLIFFGDRRDAGEAEDAKACLRMAADMQRRLAELNVKWRSEGIEQPFRVRMGINTGYCNVGNFGSADRMDYTIIGAEANLAARLQSIAEPGHCHELRDVRPGPRGGRAHALRAIAGRHQPGGHALFRRGLLDAAAIKSKFSANTCTGLDFVPRPEHDQRRIGRSHSCGVAQRVSLWINTGRAPCRPASPRRDAGSGARPAFRYTCGQTTAESHHVHRHARHAAATPSPISRR